MQSGRTSGQGAIEPPFGAHALPPVLEGLRRFGAALPRGWLARRLTSLIRRVCVAGRTGPFDVEPFPGQRARLYPQDNLSEKRVFGAPQFWDWAERAAVAEAMAAAPRPFRFVDAGANAGLYTLAVRSLGPADVLAIEPDAENLRRLEVNLDASGAEDVRVCAAALSDRPGTARLGGAGNRGERALGADGDGGDEVPTLPLLAALEGTGWDRLDALKIDIEGAEAPVLAAYLRDAPAGFWPGLVILEAQRGESTRALELLLDAGYLLAERTRMNAILTLPAAQAEAGAGPRRRN
ncbi:MAG: FkbM family methyltransferase [Pseudomonadota bacterium]